MILTKLIHEVFGFTLLCTNRSLFNRIPSEYTVVPNAGR